MHKSVGRRNQADAGTLLSFPLTHDFHSAAAAPAHTARCDTLSANVCPCTACPADELEIHAFKKRDPACFSVPHALSYTESLCITAHDEELCASRFPHDFSATRYSVRVGSRLQGPLAINHASEPGHSPVLVEVSRSNVRRHNAMLMKRQDGSCSAGFRKQGECSGKYLCVIVDWLET